MEQPSFGRDTFLAGLSSTTRDRLLALGTARDLEPGRVLLREGDTDNFHVELLLKGFVKVTVIVSDVVALLSIRVPGDLLGESPLLRDEPRTATVTTCGLVRSVAVPRESLRRFLGQHGEAAIVLAETMSDRLLWANQRRGDFAAYPAHVRLARVLADLGHRCGTPVDGGLELGVTLSQAELATMVGLADITVRKALGDLRRQGLIATGYRRLTIVDVEGLRELGAGR